jgi:hypothetical protein
MWLHKRKKEFVYKIIVNFCTPDNAVVARNILSFYIQILSQFVKPPSDTLRRYFKMFHLAPSPSSLQFLEIFLLQSAIKSEILLYSEFISVLLTMHK